MNKLIDSGAVAAAYCVADESIDAFRRFHAALYAQQPEETATVFPDNGVHWLMIMPVSTFSAANRVVVPWRL